MFPFHFPFIAYTLVTMRGLLFRDLDHNRVLDERAFPHRNYNLKLMITSLIHFNKYFHRFILVTNIVNFFSAFEFLNNIILVANLLNVSRASMKLIYHNGLYDLPILEVSCLVLFIRRLSLILDL